MNLYNATPFVADYAFGLKKSGRNCLVIVAKATYDLPARSDEAPRLSNDWVIPHKTDTYSGEPGQSAPLFENDFPPCKPKCDVILHASAHSEQPVTEMIVGFRVGKLEKFIKVIGPRHYRSAVVGVKPGKPLPFTQQPISYDSAYGGSQIDNPKAPQEKITCTSFMRNPVGIGFYPDSNNGDLVDRPLSLSESIKKPIRGHTSTKPIPQAFGPIARNWYPRSTLGGTYDQAWSDNVAPFLPEDFDERYYQSAPEDQQCDHLRGGERVTLMGLLPQQRNLTFCLPKVMLPMQAILKNGDRHNLESRIDTLTLEPDEKRFTLVWRAHITIRQSIHEMGTLIVGKPTRGWEHARMVDKPYVSMKDLSVF
ncbi:MAG: DUF2169 domain-containing protein, partial [Candidatus Thiodiazotropha sp. (ex Rostrolucina anterorostrata)]|nr:DUF2169 domain-containing protein [Candidatus Thiodiazotropha sp. (ex Rostrolucina anterorostrata)]